MQLLPSSGGSLPRQALEAAAASGVAASGGSFSDGVQEEMHDMQVLRITANGRLFRCGCARWGVGSGGSVSSSVQQQHCSGTVTAAAATASSQQPPSWPH